MMKKTLLLLAVMIGSVAAYAQDKIYLVKGNTLVGTYESSEVDYITFQLPGNIEVADAVDLSIDSKGKNFISYTVTTDKPTTSYVHGVVSVAVADYYAQVYLEKTLQELTPEEHTALLVTIMAEGFGYVQTGTSKFTQKDFDVDDDGYLFDIKAGQEYLVVAFDLTEQGAVGTHFVEKTVKTDDPAQSPGSISAELVSSGNAGNVFRVTASDDILYAYTLYGYKSVLEPYISMFGFGYTMFLFGEILFPEEFGDAITWTVEDPDEYAFYALGIDANGDWTQYATTVDLSDMKVGPEISTLSKTALDGGVNISFEISPSNVEEAYVLGMDMNTLDDMLQTTSAVEIVKTGTDITSEIRSAGEYTFVNNELPAAWYSVLVYGKTADGESVKRYEFYPRADSEIFEDQISVVQSAAKVAVNKRSKVEMKRKSSVSVSHGKTKISKLKK